MMAISRRKWFSVAGSLAAASAMPLDAQTGVRIRMAGALGDTLSEPYYGLVSKAYERAGLTVDVTTFSAGGAIMSALAGGALDVGLADVLSITNAINAGIPIAIFAASALYSSDAPTTALVVAKDGPIQTAKDIEGKTIAVNTLHTLPEISTREWLRQNGADATNVKFVEMNGSGMIESLIRGAIAAAVPGEPHLSVDKAQLHVLGKPYDVVAKSFPLMLFYARRDWLTSNADDARRLTRAIYETARWANTHMAETALVVERVAKLEPAVVQSMTRTRYATRLEPPMLQPMINIAQKYNAVRQSIPATDLIATL